MMVFTVNCFSFVHTCVYNLQIGYKEKENAGYSVDKNIFKEAISPILQTRIPAFSKAQVFNTI